MTELRTVQPAPVTGDHDESAGAALEPVLITEQEVLFGTAAGAIPPATRVTVRSRLQALVRNAFAHEPRERRPRRDYPSRLSYLEHAALSREMGRL